MAERSFTLLVVDDDRRLRDLLEKYLMEQGFWVVTAQSAEEARMRLGTENIDLMILDLMMPGESGLAFIQKWRTDHSHPKSNLPVLMLTALGEVEHRIEGLEAGADDYLSKPFEPRELILRIHKLLERVYKDRFPGKLVKLGKHIYDTGRETLYHGSEVIHLTTLEGNLLKIFSSQPGVILSREKLADELGVMLSPRTVDVQVTRLRKKIEHDPKRPLYLQTVRHRGYVLRPD
ncbi:MAG: response regulator [Caedimonas sp.]|nr:response regulator [Caedimonas sp.]